MNEYSVWECLVCGLMYDEAKGWPDDGIEPGTRWEDVPDDWLCPECGVSKAEFEMAEVSKGAVAVKETIGTAPASAAAPLRAIDSGRKPVVIIGTGLAGYHLAREFRKLSPATPLVMLTADDGRYYSKPLISTGYTKGKTPDQLATASAEAMAQELGAEIRIFTRVTTIDPTARTLVANGETLAYDKLVLAWGAQSIEAPLAGDGLECIYSINDLLDYTRFRSAMVGKKKVLIIGAGLIGSEYANDLIQGGFEVAAVEPLPTVLMALLPERAAQAVQARLTQAGVQYHFGTVVERVDQQGTGIKATLANGATVEADLVLSAIGVRPRVELARQAGLAVKRGIVTDRCLRTSAVDIFAIGDCAEVDGHVLCYVAPIMACARALAQTLAGRTTEVRYDAMPVVIKTTLCPVVANPPTRGVAGEWRIEGCGANLAAEFRAPNGTLLGFALTGEAIKQKEALAARVVPIMHSDRDSQRSVALMR